MEKPSACRAVAINHDTIKCARSWLAVFGQINVFDISQLRKAQFSELTFGSAIETLANVSKLINTNDAKFGRGTMSPLHILEIYFR